MPDPVFHIVAEVELAAGGLPLSEKATARTPGAVVALIGAVVLRPGFRSVTITVDEAAEQLALAA